MKLCERCQRYAGVPETKIDPQLRGETLTEQERDIITCLIGDTFGNRRNRLGNPIRFRQMSQGELHHLFFEALRQSKFAHLRETEQEKAKNEG